MLTSKKHSSAKVEPKSLSVEDKGFNGESLVGSRIRVWWPIDRKFYKGVVDSYDSSRKKHLVLYDDGDKEKLFMKKERWELIDEDEAKADEINLQEESANESSDAALEPKKAKSNGKSSEKGRAIDAVPKKKQKIDASAKSKSKARSEDSEGVKKAEKSEDAERQTQKLETERNGKMGDIGNKIVAAASRMSGKFQSKENGQQKETTESLKSIKKMISKSNNPKQKRPSSSSIPEKVKKPRTSSKENKSNNTDDDDESKPLVSFLKKSPEAMKALMEKLKRKKEKEAGERSSREAVKEES